MLVRAAANWRRDKGQRRLARYRSGICPTSIPVATARTLARDLTDLATTSGGLSRPLSGPPRRLSGTELGAAVESYEGSRKGSAGS